MSTTEDIEAGFHHARRLHGAGRYADAEQAYQKLMTPGPHREPVLAALTDLYLETGRPNEALDTLTRLTELLPDRLYYHAWLATLLDQWGHTEAAIEKYRAFIENNPGNTSAHFNLALLLKRQKEYRAAVDEYQRAIDLGIDDVAQVYSNMGILYSDMRNAEKAREKFEAALDVDPDYVPALFNLAGLCEETGNRDEAITLYERIRGIDPGHFESLARLAYAQRIGNADASLVSALEEATAKPQADPVVHEALWFALGKARDDLGRYDEAARAYDTANALGRKRTPKYDEAVTTRAFDDIMRTFDAAWIEAAESGSDHRPIFICGMLRSGSTLVEQLLAGHPEIRPAGELDILPWLISRRLSPYPQRAAEATREELGELAAEYVSRVHDILGSDKHVTDKRPDNFVHLGIIRAMFPQAKFIHTVRNPLDTCLSIYFQQLGEYMAYATGIESTAHYHLQHDRLMRHWKSCFGDSIFTLDYDNLVREPESVMRELVGFLELPWDDSCLAFAASDNMVKSASVWQVREGLYQSSSGRWRNYEALVESIKPHFDVNGDNA